MSQERDNCPMKNQQKTNRKVTEFPETGLEAKETYQIIREQLSLDGDPMLNLGTFSTNAMEAEAEQLFRQAMGTNFIDKYAYPNLEKIHQQIICMLGQIFNAPENCHPIGTVTVGSSEAIMLGLLAHKFNWRKSRQNLNKPTDQPNIVIGDNVHVCWKKFSLYFDVPSRIIPVETSQCILRADQVAQTIDENTIAVSCVLANTFTGQLDEIAEINELLLQVKKDKGWDIPIHVDAAIGGFLIPFVHPELLWDFRLEQVRSINVSNHKFGLVFPGMGSLLFRDRSFLPDELVFNVSYLGNSLSNYSLNFSRSSGAVLLQYYNFLRLGKIGYCNFAQETLNKAQILEANLLETGYFDIFSDSRYLPVIVLGIKNQYASLTTVYELSEKLREENWVIPAYPLPIKTDNVHVHVLRLVVKQNWTFDMIELLTQDVKKFMLDKFYYKG